MEPEFFPVSDSGNGQRTPIEAPWLDNPLLYAGSVGAGADFVTDWLVEGAYSIYVSEAAWVNGGAAASADPALPVAERPRTHEGGYWVVSLNTGSRIAIRAKAGEISFEIFKAA